MKDGASCGPPGVKEGQNVKDDVSNRFRFSFDLLVVKDQHIVSSETTPVYCPPFIPEMIPSACVRRRDR